MPGQRKVSPSGASRTAPDDERVPGLGKWLARVLVMLLLVVAGVAGVHFGADPVRKLLSRPIEAVTVEGDFRYMSKSRVENLISSSLDQDFLQLDLEQVKVILEQEPWIERAALQRQWPNTLRVRIFEQQPIARWSKVGFLNRKGDIIRVDAGDKLKHLPWLEGEDQEAVRVMRRFQELTELLRAQDLTLSSLKYDHRRSWEMELDNRVTLIVGRDSIIDRVRRFIVVFDDQLKDRWQDVERVDLRYDSGFAVAWQKDRDTSEQF